MIGIVIVAHGQLATELLNTTEFIIGKIEHIVSVMTDPKQSVEVLREELANAINEVNTGNGVLILTDMFGGTPSNISLSFLDEGKVEVLAGVNLPMLIKLVSSDRNIPLKRLAHLIKDYGKKNVILATEVLNKG
ncbi:MAG: hypothetical protein M1381_01315 [Deltaproteobacteria bacterium]|nr:hypothetical protein [Deltaproteobacteria bacterium]MCL5792116.1 hypothetical protein [Deltaproteobacteria bacterium]